MGTTVMINNLNDLEELSETAVVKYCRMCGAAKSIDRFHKDKRCLGGHDTVCKGCVNKRNRERYRRNPELQHAAQLRWELGNPEKAAAADRAFRIRNPEKRAAHRALEWALHRGRVTKQPCEICGMAQRPHAHHDDYTKPLEVRWLCPRHHGQLHRKYA